MEKQKNNITSIKHAIARIIHANHGFSLIEIMIVVVIIGILAGLAIPTFMSTTTKAKQTEAKQMLRQIYINELAFRMEHDRYWIPPVGAKLSATCPECFAALGIILMRQARYEYEITGDENSFVVTATATNLDDDPTIDQWRIDQEGLLEVVVDDAIE